MQSRRSYSGAVVTGASGMLGGTVLRELLARGVDAVGWSRATERAPDGQTFEAFDLFDYDSGGWADYRRALWGGSVDLMVHCAALTDADYCERNPGEAGALNALVPGGLAGFAREMGARFVYVSTDAVYGGEKPGRRREDEQPEPGSVYARTKLEGEGRVLAAYPEALVLRTTMFGWTLPGKRPKFAEQILGALTARKPIRLWQDAFFSPLHVGHLAGVILALAEHPRADGVVNVGSEDPISKAHFGREIAEVFGLDDSPIEVGSVDDVDLPAKRTKNVGLDVSRLKALCDQEIPTVRDGVERLYREAFDGTAEATRGRKTYP